MLSISKAISIILNTLGILYHFGIEGHAVHSGVSGREKQMDVAKMTEGYFTDNI